VRHTPAVEEEEKEIKPTSKKGKNKKSETHRMHKRIRGM
jgi:hypothetical protein